MGYVLGVDGGNTKTVALVARADGAVVGAGRGGGADIYEAPSPETAFASVDAAVRAALEAAGIGESDLLAGVFSMAGADWPEDKALIQAAMQERDFGRRVSVVNDALGALRAGSQTGSGVAVVCGTFCATAARAPDGRVWHHSFWQQSGGGYDLGLRALQAVVRTELGIEPPTALTESVLRFYDRASVEDALHLLTARERAPEASRVSVARLSRPLLDAAAEGDPTALRIAREHGATLGDYALAAARRVGLQDEGFDLVLAGGVFRHPSPLHADHVVARVREASPLAREIRGGPEPAVGALLLAFEAAGLEANRDRLRLVKRSLPPPAFFET